MAKECSKINKVGSIYSFKKQFKDLWFYAEGYRHQIIIYFILTIITSLVAMAPPYLYGVIIDGLTKKTFASIYLLLGLTALSHVAYQAIHNFIVCKTKVLSSIIKNQSRIKTFNHLFSQDYEFYETNPLGKTFDRISKGSDAVRELVKNLYKRTLVELFGIIFSISILFSINWAVAIICLAVMIIFFLYGYFTTEKMVILENKVHDITEGIYARVLDFFSHIGIIKLLNVKTKLINILNSAYSKSIEQEKVSRRYERSKVAISQIMLELSAVGVLAYLAADVMQGTLSIGIAVMVFGFVTKFTDYVNKIFSDYNELVSMRTGMYRMSLIYENKAKIKEPKNPIRPERWDYISFENIDFRYPSKNIPALENLSFKIHKGEKVAVVGLSGSGKSTIAKLLLRLYLPTSGKIKIGEVDIRNISSNDLYSMIKMVPQENELINTTIYENLQLTTDKHVTKEDIIDALKRSGSWNFIKKLPDRLNSVVGPDGIKISGGEKQRLCIARALLTRPEIIVLDEATSNLDVITERKIHESLHNLSKDITVIAITHRISSVYLFDKVIVVNDGNIVGKGTHKRLLSTNRYYKKLHHAMKKEKTKSASF